MTATDIFTNGQIFIGAMDVLAPVKEDNPAIKMSIKAHNRYTRMETGFWLPPQMLTHSTRRPMKQSAKPSAIHSMVMIR